MDIPYKEPELAILILDFKREGESLLLLESLKRHLKIPHKVYYLSNSTEDYVFSYVKNGLIDVLLVNKDNLGCGIATRQLFQACMSKYAMYVQVDQFLYRDITEVEFSKFKSALEMPNIFYVDLAGNQGNGNYSERAGFYLTERYRNIPGIENVIGSPGPFANYLWGEAHIQEFFKKNTLSFVSNSFFGDNGKISRRTYPCGGETVHYTDEKTLFIVKPLKQRYDDFPNLKLNDEEWNMVLSGNWPAQGKIPESDLKHSFLYWR